MSVCYRANGHDTRVDVRAMRSNEELNVRKTREIIDHFSPHFLQIHSMHFNIEF